MVKEFSLDFLISIERYYSAANLTPPHSMPKSSIAQMKPQVQNKCDIVHVLKSCLVFATQLIVAESD